MESHNSPYYDDSFADSSAKRRQSALVRISSIRADAPDQGDGLASSNTNPSSPLKKRNSVVFSSTAVFEHLEQQRQSEVVAAGADKPKNPRLAPLDPDRKYIPPPALSIKPLGLLGVDERGGLSPLSVRSPLVVKSPVATVTPASASCSDFRRDTIFVPSGYSSGVFCTLPAADSDSRDAPLPPFDTDRVKAYCTEASSRIVVGASVSFTPPSDPPGVCASSKPTDHRRRSNASTASSNTSAAARRAAKSSQQLPPLLVDLRWIVQAVGLRDAQATLKRAPTSQFSKAVAQTAFVNSGGVSSVSLLSGGELCLTAVIAPPSSNPPQPRGCASTLTSASSDALFSSHVFPSVSVDDVREWVTALTVSRAKTAAMLADDADRLPEIITQVLFSLLSDCEQSALDDGHPGNDDTSEVDGGRRPLVALFPATHVAASGDMTGQSEDVAPEGLEGHTIVSDGESRLFVLGGFASRDVLSVSCRGSRTSLSELLEADSRTTTRPFIFSRHCRTLRLHDGANVDNPARKQVLSSQLPLAVAKPKVVASKSLTVPGIAYHSAIMLNPPSGSRGNSTRILCFGGFLDCITKEADVPQTTESQNSKAGSSKPRPQQPHRDDSRVNEFVVRYGWRDCLIEAVPYNITADAPIIIPRGFNQELMSALDIKRQMQGVKSWDLEHTRGELSGDGGRTVLRCTNALWLYDTEAKTWAHVVAGGTAPVGRAHHTAALVGSWMLIVGGVTSNHADCCDIAALHVEQRMWIQVSILPAPIGLHPFTVVTPAALLLASQPGMSDALDMRQCDVSSLLRSADARRRIEVVALKQEGGEEDSGEGRLVLRTREQLREILARLTTADAASARRLEELRQRHMAAADESSGASSRLRKLRRPSSELRLLSEKLVERGRSERRYEEAVSFIQERYESKYMPLVRPLAEIEAKAKSMSCDVVVQWEKKRAVRLKAWERKQEEQRYPPSAKEMRKQDASYAPPVLNAADVVERLAKSPDRREFQRQYLEANHLVAPDNTSSRPQTRSSASSRKSPARRGAKEVSEALYRDEARQEHRKDLFERYVVAHERQRK